MDEGEASPSASNLLRALTLALGAVGAVEEEAIS